MASIFLLSYLVFFQGYIYIYITLASLISGVVLLGFYRNSGIGNMFRR